MKCIMFIMTANLLFLKNSRSRRPSEKPRSRLSPQRAERRRDAARDLEVSLRDISQDLFLDRQIRQRAAQLHSPFAAL
jgi:hypothetical protein